jgi:hypothetical protein
MRRRGIASGTAACALVSAASKADMVSTGMDQPGSPEAHCHNILATGVDCIARYRYLSFQCNSLRRKHVN